MNKIYIYLYGQADRRLFVVMIMNISAYLNEGNSLNLLGHVSLVCQKDFVRCMQLCLSSYYS